MTGFFGTSQPPNIDSMKRLFMCITAKISLTKPGKLKFTKERRQTLSTSFRMVLSISKACPQFADQEFTGDKPYIR